MKVLLTGASGFVGRALQDELRHGDGAYEVHLLGRADGDLADDGVAEAAIAESAARRGRPRGRADRRRALRRGARARAALERARDDARRPGRGARTAPVSSTSRPRTSTAPAVEADEQTPPAPESLYALTKLWGEQAAALCAPEGLAILRLANPYGPGVDAGQAKGAVPTMLRQADAREPIPVFRGEARTFCWIGDVVRAIRLVLESGEEGAFNIGADGQAVALADVARLACELTGAPHELIEEVEPPPGRVMTRIATERVRSLGWRPEVPLDEGMRLLLESLRAAAPA